MRTMRQGQASGTILLGAVLLLTCGAGAVAAMDSGSEAIQVRVEGESGSLEDVEIGHLGIGDTEQHFTDSGEEVVITRTESGLDLEVGGESIHIAFDPTAPHAMFIGDSDEEAQVVIQHIGDGDGEQVVWHSKCDEEDESCEEAHGYSFHTVTTDQNVWIEEADGDDEGAAGRNIRVVVVKGSPDDAVIHQKHERRVLIERIGGDGDHQGTTIIVKRVHQEDSDDDR